MILSKTASAIAHPNIALVKYWGNRDDRLHIPLTDSISMNLGDIYTQTQITLDSSLKNDQLILNGTSAGKQTITRVQQFLDHFRQLSGIRSYCHIVSTNNFPTASGIASSASAFAALTMAASKVFQLDLDERYLSRMARLGSGSASRSIPTGFVYWQAGYDHQSSYAESIAPPDHWDLIDCIAIIGDEPKTISSLEGHRLAQSSPLQKTRVETAHSRIKACRSAIIEKNFTRLTEVVELDSNLMHAVMITSTPPLFYWDPATLAVIKNVQHWRSEGLPVLYTIDAGASVHVICLKKDMDEVYQRLVLIEGVKTVILSGVGGAARLIN